MDSDTLFGSYLKTSDVKEPLDAEIESVSVEKFGREEDPERKLLVHFRGMDKPLVLNKVNQESLKEIVGTPENPNAETDDWVGVKVCLYVDPNVMYGGKRVGGVRVRPVSKKGKEVKKGE